MRKQVDVESLLVLISVKNLQFMFNENEKTASR